MKRSIATVAAVLVVMLAGCSSPAPEQRQTADSWAAGQASSTPAPAPSFDKDAEQREAFMTELDGYTSALKLKICGKADKGGESAVKTWLVSDENPWNVDDPDYAAGMWVKYCAGKLK